MASPESIEFAAISMPSAMEDAFLHVYRPAAEFRRTMSLLAPLAPESTDLVMEAFSSGPPPRMAS